MKNVRGQLALGAVCLILGLVLSMQFRMVQNNYLGGAAPAQKAQELAEELKRIREEKKSLENEVNELESHIMEIEASESKADVLVKNIRSELDKYKTIVGMTTVKGPGVMITIDDPVSDPDFPSDTSLIMNNYDLLLSMVNKLNDAGAEAISINGQRITARTEISLAGNNVNINAVPTAPPFEIKAIGNPDTLEATLNIRFGIVWEMRERYNLQVAVEKTDEVIVPRYSGVFKLRYGKSAEENKQ